MTPQPIAEPAGGPSSARVETCGTVTHPPADPPSEHHEKGNQP